MTIILGGFLVILGFFFLKTLAPSFALYFWIYTALWAIVSIIILIRVWRRKKSVNKQTLEEKLLHS